MSSYWQALTRVAKPQPAAAAALRRPDLPFGDDDSEGFEVAEGEAVAAPVPQARPGLELTVPPALAEPASRPTEPAPQNALAERSERASSGLMAQPEAPALQPERYQAPSAQPSHPVAETIADASLPQAPGGVQPEPSPARESAGPAARIEAPESLVKLAEPVASVQAAASPQAEALAAQASETPVAEPLSAAALPSVVMSALAEQASALASAEAAEQYVDQPAPIVITIDQLEIRFDDAPARSAPPSPRRSAAVVVPLDEFLRRPEDRQ